MVQITGFSYIIHFCFWVLDGGRGNIVSILLKIGKQFWQMCNVARGSLSLWVCECEYCIAEQPSLCLCSSRWGDCWRESRAAARRPPGRHLHGRTCLGSCCRHLCVHVQPPHLQCQPLLHGGQCTCCMQPQHSEKSWKKNLLLLGLVIFIQNLEILRLWNLWK